MLNTLLSLSFPWLYFWGCTLLLLVILFSLAQCTCFDEPSLDEEQPATIKPKSSVPKTTIAHKAQASKPQSRMVSSSFSKGGSKLSNSKMVSQGSRKPSKIKCKSILKHNRIKKGKVLYGAPDDKSSSDKTNDGANDMLSALTKVRVNSISHYLGPAP